MRVAALWFPDWPIQALQDTAVGACAIVSQHHVVVCNAPARRAGVRRGMRVRQAQAVLLEWARRRPDLVADDVTRAYLADLEDAAGSGCRPGSPAS